MVHSPYDTKRQLLISQNALLHLSTISAVNFIYGFTTFSRIKKVYTSELHERASREARRTNKTTSRGETEGQNRQTVIDDDHQVDERLRGTGIALSGGGHRAALFAAGVVLYLARVGRNRQVAHVASVSGGSFINAYLGQSLNIQTASEEEIFQVVGSFARQIADKGTLFATTRTWLYLGGLAILTLATASLAWIWIASPAWMPSTWLGPALIVIGVLAVVKVVAMRGIIFEHALTATLFSRHGRATRLSDLRSRNVLTYSICDVMV
jgi:hypothetical protein